MQYTVLQLEMQRETMELETVEGIILEMEIMEIITVEMETPEIIILEMETPEIITMEMEKIQMETNGKWKKCKLSWKSYSLVVRSCHLHYRKLEWELLKILTLIIPTCY